MYLRWCPSSLTSGDGVEDGEQEGSQTCEICLQVVERKGAEVLGLGLQQHAAVVVLTQSCDLAVDHTQDLFLHLS